MFDRMVVKKGRKGLYLGYTDNGKVILIDKSCKGFVEGDYVRATRVKEMYKCIVCIVESIPEVEWKKVKFVELITEFHDNGDYWIRQHFNQSGLEKSKELLQKEVTVGFMKNVKLKYFIPGLIEKELGVKIPRLKHHHKTDNEYCRLPLRVRHMTPEVFQHCIDVGLKMMDEWGNNLILINDEICYEDNGSKVSGKVRIHTE